MLVDKVNYTDIPFFLTKNPYTNDFNLVTGSNATKQSLKNILLTTPGERQFDQEFGTKLTIETLHFDNLIERYEFLNSLKIAVLRYEPRINDLNVSSEDNKLIFDIKEKNKTIEAQKNIQLTLSLQ